MNNIIIKKTQNYRIEVALNDVGSLCYKIINNTYNVVEIETFMLPQALKYIEDLEAGLQALKDMEGE